MRIPPERRAARADARLVGAWLHRAEGARPLDQPPALLSFTGADFMERFFEGLGRTGATWNPSAWTPRVAYRDWCELPRATRDLGGTARLYHTLQRRNPLHGELDSQDGGGQLEVALSDEREGHTWLRKLYLPLHRHFTLITTELLCDAPGTPRIDPKRVVEVGCVVRRLILDEKRERWEDWITAPDGSGVWVELEGLDQHMRTGDAALDPKALRVGTTYGGRSDTTMRAVLGVTDVTSHLSLSVTPLAALPSTMGEAGRHTAHFGMLPVMTREQERPEPPPSDLAAARKALVAEAQARLNAIFTGDRTAAINDHLGALWREVVAAAKAYWSRGGLSDPLCDSPWWGADRTLRWGDTLSRGALDASSASVAPTDLDVVKVLWTLCRARRSLYQQLRPDQAWQDGAALSGLSAELDLLPQPEASEGSGPYVSFNLSLYKLHRAGQRLEQAADDLRRAMEASSALAPAALDQYAASRSISLVQALFTHNVHPNASDTEIVEALKIEGLTCGSLLATFGVNLDGSLARVLLVCPRLPIDDTRRLGLNLVIERMDREQRPPDPALVSALRPQVPMPRFDADHIYAARCFARVRGLHPCDPEQIVWSQRTEPYLIADPLDLLGMPPTAMRLPDLPKLIADIPKMVKARALPMAAVHTPADSGFVTGEEATDTRRGFGVAWICSFGIPVFTICAWVLFLIIFSILIMIPGFAWMLLLKFCVPVPAPKRA